MKKEIKKTFNYSTCKYISKNTAGYLFKEKEGTVEYDVIYNNGIVSSSINIVDEKLAE